MATSSPPKQDTIYDSPSIGWQHNSKRQTMPEYSFGTGGRGVGNKIFMSKKAEKRKAVMNSPGPVYGIPSSVGEGPKYTFGTEEQRVHPKALYPDSSVDLTCSIVDSQTVKFDSTKSVHFGTENRMNSKNAEAMRDNPSVLMGSQSPPGFDYNPEDAIASKASPRYSFAPRGAKAGDKCPPRMNWQPSGTPRHVGPGSHAQPSGVGAQPRSERKSAPAWSFGGKPSSYTPRNRHHDFALLDPSPELSSLGRQVVSSARSAPSCGFGTSTRDHSARTHLVVTDADKGPIGQLPKPRFHLEMPAPERNIPKPGM